jgi:hypothetical protein
MLSGDPVIELSMAITGNPSVMRRSLKCDPRNPAPPVTTAIFLEEVASNIPILEVPGNGLQSLKDLEFSGFLG